MPPATPAEPQIHALMAEVLAELPAIGKHGQAPAAMGGYAFRGIEDVLNALNPILSAKRLYFTPECLERIETLRQTNNGKALYVVNLHMRYTFWAPDATFVQAETWGEGSDSGDKATQKALTAAMKYMLFEVFCINTSDQAANDAERHDVPESEVTPKEQRRKAWGDKPLPADWSDWDEMDDAMQRFQDGVKSLPPEPKEAVTKFLKDKKFGWPLTLAQFHKALDYVKELQGEKKPEPQPDGFGADDEPAKEPVPA